MGICFFYFANRKKKIIMNEPITQIVKCDTLMSVNDVYESVSPRGSVLRSGNGASKYRYDCNRLASILCLRSWQGRKDPKKDRKAERTDEEGFIASRSSISLRVRRGPPTPPLSLYEQATETCFSTGRPHHLPSSNPGSTGLLLLPQRPRYFVVVSSSMPPFFVSCSLLVRCFDSLSLSFTLQVCLNCTLALISLCPFYPLLFNSSIIFYFYTYFYLHSPLSCPCNSEFPGISYQVSFNQS